MSKLKKIRMYKFRYVLIEEGCAWRCTRNLFGVTQNGKVYYTNEYNKSNFWSFTKLKCQYIGKLNTIELGLQPKNNILVLDANLLTVYDVKNKWNIVHMGHCFSEKNPILYKNIMDLYGTYLESKENEE